MDLQNGKCVPSMAMVVADVTNNKEYKTSKNGKDGMCGYNLTINRNDGLSQEQFTFYTND